MTMKLRAVPAVMLMFVTISAGCSRADLLAGLDAGPASEAVLIGNDQQAAAGAELAEPVTVKVLDAAGRPVAGQMVNFVVTAGGGEVYAGASVTDTQGLARDWWTLGAEPGVNRLEVRAVDSATGAPVVFGTFQATAF